MFKLDTLKNTCFSTLSALITILSFNIASAQVSQNVQLFDEADLQEAIEYFDEAISLLDNAEASEDDPSLYEFSVEETVFLGAVAGTINNNVSYNGTITLDYGLQQRKLKILSDEVKVLDENLNKIANKHGLHFDTRVRFSYDQKLGIFVDRQRSSIYLNDRVSPAYHYYPDRIPRSSRLLNFFALSNPIRNPFTKAVDNEFYSVIKDFQDRVKVSPNQANFRAAMQEMQETAARNRIRRRWAVAGLAAITAAYYLIPGLKEQVDQKVETVVNWAEPVIQIVRPLLEQGREELANLIREQSQQLNQRPF